MKPNGYPNLRAAILAVLEDGCWHDGGEFLSGSCGVRCSSYAQRISQLRAEGHIIECSGRGGHDLGRYRLIERVDVVA